MKILLSSANGLLGSNQPETDDNKTSGNHILFAGPIGSVFEKVRRKPVLLILSNACLLCNYSFYLNQKAVRELELNKQ